MALPSGGGASRLEPQSASATHFTTYRLYSLNCLCINPDSTQLPVRRLSHPTPARTLDAIRQQIQAFALVFPNVAFTLENTHSAKDEKDMVLRIPKVRPSVRYRLN
jgi:hypothetical protein